MSIYIYKEIRNKLISKLILAAPKKSTVQGVHKADAKVAPAKSNDFSTNQVGDQSTENRPEDSHITYETHDANQSTENNPELSGITYDQNYQENQVDEQYDENQVEQNYEENQYDDQ